MEVFDNLRSFFFTEIYNTNIIGNQIVIYNFNSLKLQHVLQRVGLKSLRDLSLSSLSQNTILFLLVNQHKLLLITLQLFPFLRLAHGQSIKPISRDSSSTQKVHFQDFSIYPYTISFILQVITNVSNQRNAFMAFTQFFSTRQPLHRVNHFSKPTVSNIKKVFCQLIKMVFLSCFYLIIIMDDKVYNI